jgi:anti-sigma B factor antagonist
LLRDSADEPNPTDQAAGGSHRIVSGGLMKVAVTEKSGISVVSVSGKMMGGPDTGELDEKLYSLLAKGNKNAVVDLLNCEWINSSGLSILIHHYKKFKDAGGELRLANLTDKIERIMVISRLTEVFSVHDTLEEAVAAAKGK